MSDKAQRVARLSPAGLAAALDQLRARPSPSTIPRRSSAAVAPLSYVQAGIWFDEQLRPGDPTRNLFAAFRLRGALQPDALASALASVVERQHILRTVYPIVDGVPMQQLVPNAALPLSLPERRHLGVGESSAERWAEQETRLPFALAHDPPVRVGLLRISPDDHLLALTLHHIAGDSISMMLLLSGLANGYRAGLGLSARPAATLPIQYADYAAWQRERLASGSLDADLAYWRRQLADVPTVRLTDRPATGAPVPAELHAVIPGPAVARLRAAAADADVSLFVALLAGFYTTLQRHGAGSDLGVGVPFAGRQLPELEPLLGNFTNTLVLRARPGVRDTFRDLLAHVRQVVAEAHRHAEVPFEKLVEDLRPPRTPGRAPFFSSVFNFVPAPGTGFTLPGLEVSTLPIERRRDVADLAFELRHLPDGEVALTAGFDREVLGRGRVERMVGDYLRILEEVASAVDQRIVAVPAPPSPARVHGEVSGSGLQRCLHELFEEQASRTPAEPALLAAGGSITFAALARASNRIARCLRDLGVRREAVVGVWADRGTLAIASMLGILKAGAAFLPLDAQYPTPWLEQMIHDAGTSVVLTDRRRELLRAPRLVAIDGILGDGDLDDTFTPGEVDSQNLAYVIYTSGSTGRPKGVLGDHRGMVNRLAWGWETFPFAAGEVACHKTPLSFVDAIAEIFLPLLRGVPLCIPSREAGHSPDQLVQEMARAGVTRIVLVPSLLRALIEQHPRLGERLPALRRWICSGEALTPELCREFRTAAPGARLVNLYGTSEIAADATWDEMDDSGSVCIGRPIANMEVHVLDERMQRVPAGVQGDLYVGGVGVARGYRGLPGATAARFLPDPFGPAGSRLYRTGDRGRRRPDGKLECSGRADGQVKIRGHRIDLGEIEAVIRSAAHVTDALVSCVRNAAGELELLAYVRSPSGEAPPAAALAAYARARLPAAMVPARFTVLEEFPRLPNGKVDRRLLEALPDQAGSGAPVESLRDDVERELAGIWREVLDVETVGRDEDFFALGGHSLRATRMLARVARRLGVELPVSAVFASPTIASLAREVRAASLSGAPAPQPIGASRPSSVEELLEALEPDGRPVATD